MNITSQKDNRRLIILIIVILVIAIIVYAVSFGQIDYISDDKDDSIKEKQRLEGLRYLKLRALIEKKTGLKKKLDRRFRFIFLSVRILFVLIYIGLNALLCHFWNINDLGSVMNWNQAVWISLIALNGIFIGSELTLKNVVNYFKTVIKNQVYSKYVNIDQQIETHQNEVHQLIPNLSPEYLAIKPPEISKGKTSKSHFNP